MENTPKSAGVILWGDTITLQSIHELSHKLWQSSVIADEDLRECLMSFSYDVRKCYENKRESNKLIDFHNQHIPIYGVHINWIDLLLDISFMRFCMAYVDTSKKEQSYMYLLEYYLESCLHKVFPKTSVDILASMQSLPYLNSSIIPEILPSRVNYFLKLNNKTKRTSALLRTIQSFSPYFSDRTVNFEEYEPSVFELDLETIHW